MSIAIHSPELTKETFRKLFWMWLFLGAPPLLAIQFVAMATRNTPLVYVTSGLLMLWCASMAIVLISGMWACIGDDHRN